MKTIIWGLALTAGMIPGTMRAGITDIEGWRTTTELASYPPEKLWEVINGAAEQYLAYGVRELRTCDLEAGDLAVTVMIFEMASPLEAYGIYRLERPTGAETLDIGAAACLAAPYQGAMLKNHYYVKVDAYTGELSPDTGGGLLTALADRLPGAAALPVELELLPKSGRIPDSEGYVASGFLGLNELNRCLHASYEAEDSEPYQIFLLFPPPGDTVASTWSILSGKWQPAMFAERPVLTRQVPYQGLAGLMLTGDGIVGGIGGETREQLFTIFATWDTSRAAANRDQGDPDSAERSP